MNVPVAEQYLICGYKSLFSCEAGSFIMAGIWIWEKKKHLKKKNTSWGLSHTVGYVNNNFVIGQTQRVSHEGHGAK